jgi:hypothetical protein
MSATPKLITDTRGNAGHMLITPLTDEGEIRGWLYDAYGHPVTLRFKFGEKTATAVDEAVEAAIDIINGHGTGEQREYVSSYLGLKIEDITEWDSSILEWVPSDDWWNTIEATAPDGVTIKFHAEDTGGDIVANFYGELPVPEYGKDYFDSADGDWSIVERYIPRSEWPDCMRVGKRGPKQRNPAPEVQAVIKAAEASRAECFAETYHVILEWTRGEHLGDTVRDDGAVIQEDWTHSIEDWTVRIAAIIENSLIEDSLDENDTDNYDNPPEWLRPLSDGFKVDPEDENAPDTTEGAPFEEAEERLLAKAGLPRSIVLRVDGPW